ncbi:hypothetical protein [Jeongeupia chitinilytica]|uniref:Lipoprotein n=1 Tax=Jeongeupia chitinilytica TaxID=1041641 RepID=A0ABQ3GWW9_9NEIS|nr:hypothetical protein [Jeongeupia chitinilytica]GHD57700.1 hypothetical protein GCM10007350_06350 [Jeongeupia chitinilytica]
MRYLKQTGVMLLMAAGLSACGKGGDADEATVKVDQAEIISALNNELHTAERSCIPMPVRFAEPVAKDFAKETEPNGAQLATLVKIGLIKAVPAEGGKVEFEPTDAGREAYTGLADPAGPGFCSGTLEVDKIVDDKTTEERSDFRRHEVRYTYKIESPASWQGDAEVLANYPDFAKLVEGVGKAEFKAVVESRGQGWRVDSLGDK